MPANSKLYLIGNGFDLLHGSRSFFEDFARYAQRNHPVVAEAIEHIFRWSARTGGTWRHP
ncbi:AbiH family protein [Cupriavidus sp. AcVe19-6a]|uniref:AbiH family protein n=1 Tax=Cupriavidus sp. AcVe19-6a TaxID=2821358 RepID=UPI001AE524DE|nr:hypothetical protein [Cupriavidus sp. AcVe19-6a]